MNSATVVILFLAIAKASAVHLGLGLVHHGHHVPSGSVSVGANGAVIAGPAGSVHTNNGLYGHGAGARLSGPAGNVATHGGHARLVGPGHHHGHVGVGVVPAIGHYAHSVVHHVAPVVHHGYVSPVALGHHGVVAHGLLPHHYGLY